MNIIEFELEREALKDKLVRDCSNQARIIFLHSYFEKILLVSNSNFSEAYLSEFIYDYIYSLKTFSVFGINPQITQNIISQANVLAQKSYIVGYKEISETANSLSENLEYLQKILNGGTIHTTKSKPFFPLLEDGVIKEIGIAVGVLESVTIKINKSQDSDKFIIVPSEKEIEEKISEQVKLSWLNAVSIAKKYIKRIHSAHEVIISFDKKAGFCKGNSLGTALTLSFIEEIFRTYNSPVSIRVGNGIAFTGGMDAQGKMTNTSEEIIKQKTELVFFSDISIFIVPNNEESWANEKLNELKKEFQQRDLKVIGIENIDDLLDRRTIVEIKKQPVIVRSKKFVKKNWAAISAILVLCVFLSFFIIRDIDTNPVSFTADGNKIYIKNKSGKVLWQKWLPGDKILMSNNEYLTKFCRIIDINSDGTNEVIISNEQTGKSDEIITSMSLRCYDYTEKIIWSFAFTEKVSSELGELDSIYNIHIIDTLVINGKKSMYLFANNGNSFSSAVFSVNILTGKRNPGTIWCSGHTYDGLIKDINNDNKKDLLCIGVDNGYEDVVVFGFEPNEKNFVRPSVNGYTIRNYPFSDFITLIRIPKTDFDYVVKNRFQAVGMSSLNYIANTKEYFFILDSDPNQKVIGVWYKLNKNLVDFNISVDNQFRIERDSLVAKGILNKPFSDTDEYTDLIKSKILYWKNNKWVKREELE